MKKIILILAIVFSSMFSSYAYNQQSVTAYAGIPTNYAYMGVNINSYCTQLLLNCTWTMLATSGSVQAYDDILLAEYNWGPGGGDRYHSANGSYRYWGYIRVFIGADGSTGASGTATLTWW
ncbi:hypothetical protein [Sphingobacterium sp. SGR-19]|uniref:hypothetical protein n=1 Tax=Sphingobacterium sp. SGR-19 TaxID=2710886 RepID=UPI0013EC5CD7|nr:hypothetical protein [Sphingobacterium sp. SGR-19]NGM65021.1 hypothetical protein [Sphingobacterium sp. SGR-19]